MASIRICLRFGPSLLSKKIEHSEQCWMLVDTTRCKFVYDLEYLIKKKFFTGKKGPFLNLYLDDFLLPSKEKIEIIRDNDVICVKDAKVGQNIEKSDVNEINPKKRKLEISDDSKKNKKIKHSVIATDKDEKVPQERRTNNKQTSSHINRKNRKTKRQKAVDFLHKVSQEVSNKISWSNTMSENSTKKKHEQDNLNSKDEKSTLTKDMLKPSSLEKQSTISSKKDVAQLEKSGNKKAGKSLELINGIQKINGDKFNEKGDIKDKKSVSKKSSSSLLVTPDMKCSDLYDYDGTVIHKLNNVRESKEYVNRTGGPKPVSQISRGNHIRFDNDDDDGLKCPPTACVTAPEIETLPLSQIGPFNLPLPNIPSLRQSNTQSPRLSPILPMSKSSPRVNGQPNTKKDVYTYKSNIMESTRMEKQPKDFNIMESTRLEKQPKDFCAFPLLHGPPRVGETVAYKVLELSKSYTPVISKYKEGKVLAFNSIEKKFKLKLSKASLSRAQGDGHVSFKFELFEVNKEDGELIIPDVEIPDEVDVEWSTMIEPRLVAPGN